MPDFAPKKGMADAAIELLIDAVLAEATLKEKVGMMSGHGFFKQYLASNKNWGADPYRAGGGIERLGIEPFYFTDGPRGVARGEDKAPAGEWIQCVDLWEKKGDPHIERYVFAPPSQ